jgi:hypothetical protein
MSAPPFISFIRRSVLLCLMAGCVQQQPKPHTVGKDNSGYLRLSEAAALERAKSAGSPCRIISRDGVSYPCTMDFCAKRLNFSLDDGRVMKVTKG